MIVDIRITEKSFGPKRLYKNVRFSITDNQKIGIIGRNGVGKSTLFGILAGNDKDYDGEVIWKRGVSVVSSRQEHHEYADRTVLEYILGDLPEYATLSHIIDTYPDTMGDNVRRIAEYTDALQRFSDLGYYDNQGLIVEDLKRMHIDETMAHNPLAHLSGGQKRLVEVVKIMHSNAHLALIDEPTNHMDYAAKDAFISWMQGSATAMLVITHDRDVLAAVDTIIEIRDGEAHVYDGNYEYYLKLNAHSTQSAMHEYEVTQRRIANLKDKVIQFRRLKEKSRDPDTIKQFKRRENQAAAELMELERIERPQFWIDKDSAAGLKLTAHRQYEKFKSRNIRLHGLEAGTEAHGRLLIDVSKLVLGYEQPLFQGVSFQLRERAAIELRGRNGAGKTTLIRKILETAGTIPQQPSRCFAGTIEVDSKVSVGVYEQEISRELFGLTLGDAIEKIYHDKHLPLSETKLRQLLADYLFEPSDKDVPVELLSGGQKARVQLIAMLAHAPTLLVLDEPTNHLDLPSIEELETALTRYSGAILYVSHDSYFQKAIGGETIEITPS